MKQFAIIGLAGVALAGCAVVPVGPTSVAAAPGPGKTAAQFQQDRLLCAQAASADARPDLLGVAPSELQDIYDTSFAQCLKAQGERVTGMPRANTPAITFGAAPHPFYPAPQPYYYMGGPHDYPPI